MRSKYLSLFYSSLILLFISALSACTVDLTTDANAKSVEGSYDADLAEQLGADDYGMRSYVFAILKTGPNDGVISDEAKRKELFAGHFANMSRLAEEGKLVLAGPLDGKMLRRGIFVFNVTNIDEAKELVQTDPSIKAGIFEVELHKYYGSAALMQVNDIHQRIQKTKIE